MKLKDAIANTPTLYHTLQAAGILLLVGACLVLSLKISGIFLFSNFSGSFSGPDGSAAAGLPADAGGMPITHGQVPEAADSFKVLFVGDMMLDRGVRSVANNRGFDYIFGPATTTFSEHDVVIGNLEGTITRYPSKLVLPNNKAISGFQFTFSTSAAPALRKAGIDVVSLANNHALDFGQDGLNQTRENLDAVGIQHFGSYMNNSMLSTTTCPRPDFCIGLVGWNEFGYANDEKIIQEIQSLRPNVQYLVVYPHWGVEYEPQPTSRQRSLAQSWIEAGADAVIGGHAHIVQRIERHASSDGRIAPIFYSLGNFIFDQYFSFDTTHGVALSIEFKKGGERDRELDGTKPELKPVPGDKNNNAYEPRYSLIPFSSIGSRVSLPTEEARTRLLNTIEKISASGTRDWLSF